MKYNSTLNEWFLEKNFKFGRWQFKFQIDGNYWTTSSDYKTKQNSEGILNNFIQVYPTHTEDYLILEQIIQNSKNFLKVKFLLNEWSIKAMIQKLPQDLQSKEIYIELWGDWDNWENPFIMEQIQKSQEESIKIWGKILLLEEKQMNYKFKLNGQWCLDPYRRLSDDDQFQNHFFDPFLKKNIETQSETSCEVVDLFNVTVNEKIIQDELINDLWGHSMNLIEDVLYIIGGVGRNSFQNILYQIDINSMKLSREHMDDKNAPEMLAFHKTIVYGEKIIIYGGQTDYQVSNKYHTYNTKTKQWTSFRLKNKIGLREHFSVCYKENTCRIYFFGGYYFHPDDREEKQFNDLWELNLQLMTFELVQCENQPSPRCHHSANMFDWKMYIFGGCQIINYQREVFNDLYEIDLSKQDSIWEKIIVEGPQPAKRFGHISAKLQKYLIIHGGKSSDNDLKEKYLGDLWVFHTQKKQWTEIQYENKINVSFHSAVIYCKKLLIFGGKSSDKIKQNKERGNILYEFEF